MHTVLSAQTIQDMEAERIMTGMQAARLTVAQQVTSVLYRQRKYIIGAIGLAFLIGALVTFVMPRQYTAVAAVQLEQQVSQVVSAPELDPQRNQADAERFLQTQTDLVYSRSLAEGVFKRLDAKQVPAIMAALGVDDANNTEGAIRALQKGVRVELGLNTRLASIKFTSRDPAVSAKLANAYAEQLVDSNLTAKMDTSSRARQYLISQLAKAKQSLQESEQRQVAAARSADLTSGDAIGNPDAGPSLRAQQLGTLMTSLSEATARRIATEQQWQQVKDTPALALPLVQENRAVQEMLAEKARASATLAEEKQRYTSEYPSETEAQVNKLDNQIAIITQNVKRSYFDAYQTAARQEQSLIRVISGLRGAALAERERGIEYNALDRDLQTNKAFYDGLLQRYKEVVAASGAPAVNVTIIDRAAAPLDPSSPAVVRNLALALILGMIAAMVIALIREKRQDVIHSAIDLGGVGHLPFLGAIPRTATATKIENALNDPRSPQSEAYASVAVAVQQLGGGELPSSLLITSSAGGEGKSITALSLARGMSRMGQRTLLIDGDLRRPSLARRLGLSEGPGFADALANEVAPQSVVQTKPRLGFDVVCVGQVRAPFMSLLTRDRIRRLLDHYCGLYDTVIIDGPPLLGIADAVMLSDMVEAVVMVVEANRVEAGQLSVAISRLPAAKPIGTMMTKFDAKMAGVPYGNEQYYTA
jgi:succinoglycan biosynthesis transport protein ExoP